MLLVDSVSVIKSIRSVTNCHPVKAWERGAMEICEARQCVEYSSHLCTIPPKGEPSRCLGGCQGGAKPQGSISLQGASGRVLAAP